MKTKDFLKYNINKRIHLNNKIYVLSKDEDGFFTIKCDDNIVLILNEDKFTGEDLDLAEEINKQIFDKKLMDLTEKIIDNQSKMINFLLK